MFVSDEMHQNHFCSQAPKNLRNLNLNRVTDFCSIAGTNVLLRTPILG